jgi:hypothetical protein
MCCRFAVAMAMPSSTPELTIAVACLAALLVCDGVAFLLCFCLNDFAVHGIVVLPWSFWSSYSPPSDCLWRNRKP